MVSFLIYEHVIFVVEKVREELGIADNVKLVILNFGGQVIP